MNKSAMAATTMVLPWRPFTTSPNSCGPMDSSDIMPTIEARLRRKLHQFAVELPKLAYTVPNGVSTLSCSCPSRWSRPLIWTLEMPLMDGRKCAAQS